MRISVRMDMLLFLSDERPFARASLLLDASLQLGDSGLQEGDPESDAPLV
jgi:hypothetical protein